MILIPLIFKENFYTLSRTEQAQRRCSIEALGGKRYGYNVKRYRHK